MKDIIGYEGLYAVDEDGNVWSKNYNRTGKLGKLKATTNRHGYCRVNLYKDKKGKEHRIHRLVAEAYLSDYSAELNVDHIDRDKLNNNLSNLRMVTTQQNAFNTKAKGCSWHKGKNKWRAYIRKDGKLNFLGYFVKEEDAHQAYLDAKKIYHTM